MDIVDIKLVREINRKIIVSEIIKSNKISRAELANRTHLNKSTVSRIVEPMLADGVLIEYDEPDSEYRSKGRPPIIIGVNDDYAYIISIEIGSNYLYGALVGLSGEIASTDRIELSASDYDTVIDKIGTLIDSLRAKMKDTKKLHGISFGVQGAVNLDEIIVYTPHLNLNNVDLKAIIEEKYQCDALVENDANLSAKGEYCYGGANIADNLFFINVKISVAMGNVYKGKIYRGASGTSGEIGHSVLYPNGLLCECGSRGCFEKYVNEDIIKYVLNIKDEKEKQLRLEQLIDDFSVIINNVNMLFDPELIVINSDELTHVAKFIDLVKAKNSQKIKKNTVIKFSSVKNNACVLGGAAILIEEFFGIPSLVFR